MSQRILIAKVGLDGHDRGIKVVARILRDAGFEVIYSGLFQTPQTVAAAAVDEDVDAVGLSMLSGAHMTLAPLVVEQLRARGSEIPVIVGGIVPNHDLDELRSAGVAAILTPGATGTQIVAEVRRVLSREWQSHHVGARMMNDYVPPLADIRFALTRRGESRRDPRHRAVRARRRRHRVRRAGRGRALHRRRRRARRTATATRSGRSGSPTAPSWRRRASPSAYRKWVDPGYGAMPFDPDFGGGGFPWVAAIAVQEMVTSANMAFSLCPLLTQGAIDAIHVARLRRPEGDVPAADVDGGVDRVR